MATERLAEVLATLLIYAQSITGYSPPDNLPEISFVPHAELERAACNRHCEIYAWYPFDLTIYLDDRLDPVGDAGDRSILLHELVHYLQHTHGAFDSGSACENWGRRELEAYEVQARWLAAQGIVKPLYSGIGPAPWTLACRYERPAPRDPGSGSAR